MTQQKNHDGHGGSTLVKDGEVKHTPATLNPGDPGYAKAVRDTPVHDEKRKGALNRSPSYRDLDQQSVEDRERAKKPAAKHTPASSNGGKP